MQFGLFFLLQVPRPWGPDAEFRAYNEALEQIELADKLGFHSAWVSEHHFVDEYAQLSAPELFLTAASQRTSKIRLGHGIVHMLPKINNPFRVAERIATLDLLSDGRVEFGTGESVGERELGAFGVDLGTKAEQWDEATQATVRMLTEDPFTGFEGEHLSAPSRTVLPRVRQHPHPPLWVACSRPEGLHKAAHRGAGALVFSLSHAPETARERLVEPYYQLLESDDWVPLSDTVNPSMLTTVPTLVHEDAETARARGAEGVDFLGYGMNHFRLEGDYSYEHGRGVYESFERERESNEQSAGASAAAAMGASPSDSADLDALMKGAVGGINEVRDFMCAYEEAGLDLVLLQMQLGRTSHEHICESMELFAREIMPEFEERHEAQQRRKFDRLQPAIDRALERRRQGAQPAVSVIKRKATL